MPIAFQVWLHALSIIVAAYLLGSIPTGYLLIRIFRKQDIRTLGSGNIGATNVLRSGAKGLGAATFLLDVLKGAAAVLVGVRLAAFGFPPIPPHNAAALAALCAVLGHMYPIWLGLRGGKGVATAFGVFLMLSPWAAVGALAVFIVVFALSRFVSLASIAASVAFPIFAWIAAPWSFGSHFNESWPHSVVIFTVTILVPALVIFKHRQNIQRLMAGTEYRFGGKGKQPRRSAEDTA